MTINEKINKLRDLMKERKIDMYVIPMSDFHLSEYVGDHFKTIQYMSGFTGSNATVVVSMSESGLWTDGRYFIQAKHELSGSEVKLFEMGEEGVPTVSEYLKAHLERNCVLGFDGRVISKKQYDEFLEIVEEKSGSIYSSEDLVDIIWADRPALPKKPIYILEEKYAGESTESKINFLRLRVKEKKADAFLLTSLYDIAWLLNLRGDDIPCVPVFMSYVFVTEKDVTLYAFDESVSQSVREYLASNGIEIRDYEKIYDDLKSVSSDIDSILIDDNVVNAALCQALGEVSFISDINPTELMKSVKNDVEITNTKLAHIKDGVAVTKFIYWLKNNIKASEISEVDAANKLEEFRKEQENYIEPSFDTISAYGKNAAMMHYEATEENFSYLKPEGLYLVDSGGHYYEGTTDITRTIVLGPVTDKMKEYFTVTLRSNLRLMEAHFPEGVTGQNLDVLARGPVWDMGLDYRCGTGHGVGHILNVHEGPNNFRWRITDKGRAFPLKSGMITTDEPGLYIEDEFGIRHENELLCVPDKKTEYGNFLKLEPLTFVPFDLDAVDASMFTYLEKESLNRYHKEVYEKISPYLNDDEAEWLKYATREI